jgi:polar amino acid transport system substrate-binding protein
MPAPRSTAVGAGLLGLGLLLAACGSSARSAAPAASTGSTAASPAVSAACLAVQAKHPSVVGKKYTIGNAPTIPGYETIDPQDPSKIVGFDVDFIDAVSKCAGYTYTFSRADFQTLVPSLQAGRIDMVISNLIASPARAKIVDFVAYQKDEEALIVAKGNPKGIHEVSDLCGKRLAVFPGTLQAMAAQTQSDKCKSEGHPAITINTYADFNGCLQGMLNDRSDAFINPTDVVAQTVAKYPSKLDATPPIAEFRNLIGIGFNQKSTELRDANLDAVKAVQAAGTETALFTKWKQDPTAQADAQLLP